MARVKNIKIISRKHSSGPAGIYKSEDGGASWRDITPADPNNEKGWGCYFLNQNEGVFLVGGCASGIQAFYRTVDGGQSWSASYGTIPNTGLSDAIIYRDGNGFAVSSGLLWQTTDYGRSWRVFASTGTRIWTEELAIFNRSFLLPTSGTDCDGQSRGVGSLRFSTDRFSTFREFQTGNNMFGTFLLDEQRGWGVGDGAAVYYTDDAGKNWVLRNCGVTGDMDDVFFINDSTGWIAGNGLFRSNFNSFKKPVFIEPDTDVVEICKGDSLLLTATDGFTSYTWSDGIKAQSRYAVDSGEYIIRAYDKFTCQESQDTIAIKYKPSLDPIIVADKTEICDGDSIHLTLKGAFVSHMWSNGDTSVTTTVRKSGRYQITVLDLFGCTLKSNALDIVVHPNPRPVITTNRRTTICLDESITLSAPPGFDKYEWSSGETTPNITTSTAGSYTVTVTDEYGCVGSAAIITVIVLNTKNKINIELSSTDGDLIVPDHNVGELSCSDLLIRNVSTSEYLNITEPMLYGNVFCSIPRTQLPLLIPPLSFATLTICCSAVDTGFVHDTLMLPDTCSPTIIPIRSHGLPYGFTGTSRCDVSTSTLVFRAGSSYRLSAPYPMPASEQLSMQVMPAVSGLTLRLVDALGVVHHRTARSFNGSNSELQFNTSDLATGTYHALLFLDGELLHAWPVSVQH